MTQEQQPLSSQEKVMRIRMLPLTHENAERAALLVAAFPETCSTPFDSTLYRNPLDLVVKTWVKGRDLPNFPTLQKMLAGTEPIACPVKLHPHQQRSRRPA